MALTFHLHNLPEDDGVQNKDYSNNKQETQQPFDIGSGISVFDHIAYLGSKKLHV